MYIFSLNDNLRYKFHKRVTGKTNIVFPKGATKVRVLVYFYVEPNYIGYQYEFLPAQLTQATILYPQGYKHASYSGLCTLIANNENVVLSSVFDNEYEYTSNATVELYYK